MLPGQIRLHGGEEEVQNVRHQDVVIEGHENCHNDHPYSDTWVEQKKKQRDMKGRSEYSIQAH